MDDQETDCFSMCCFSVRRFGKIRFRQKIDFFPILRYDKGHVQRTANLKGSPTAERQWEEPIRNER